MTNISGLGQLTSFMKPFNKSFSLSLINSHDLAVLFNLFFRGTSWDRIGDLQRCHPGMLCQLVL